jgi:ribonuclease HI
MYENVCKCKFHPLSTSYHGELQAVDLALTEILEVIPPVNRPIHLLSDCQSALQVAASPKIPKDFGALHHDIQLKAEKLQVQGAPLHLKWIAGHISLHGNDAADEKAKQAAKQAICAEDNTSKMSLQEAKSRIQKKAMERWEKKCKTHSVASTLLPPLSTKTPKSMMHRKAETRRNRLILGHTTLQGNLNRIFPDLHPSPECECGFDIADRDHFLMHCSLHHDAREKMVDQIEAGYISTQTMIHLRTLSIERLIGPNKDLPPEMRNIILSSIETFLLSTLSTDI